MSFKTTEGKFKCEKCRSYFIDEDEVLCENCEAKQGGEKKKKGKKD